MHRNYDKWLSNPTFPRWFEAIRKADNALGHDVQSQGCGYVRCATCGALTTYEKGGAGFGTRCPGPPVPAERFKAGDLVEVLINGEWKAGRVISVDPESDRLVYYIDLPENEDDPIANPWVARDEIREYDRSQGVPEFYWRWLDLEARFAAIARQVLGDTNATP